MKKKYFVLVLIFTMCFAGFTVAAAEEVDETFELPFMITSAGQSPCYQLYRVILRQFDLETDLVDSMATTEDLENVNTLIVAIGASDKGLGAAGISPGEEIDRIMEVIEEAREREIKIVGVHTGRMDRFGDTSQRMIEAVLPYCDHLIVVEHDNINDYFKELSEEHGVFINFVEDRMSAGEVFSNMVIVN